MRTRGYGVENEIELQGETEMEGNDEEERGRGGGLYEREDDLSD